MFFRIGGAAVGKATNSLIDNENDSLIDHIWAWRADHGTGVGWTSNTADNGLTVNGNNVLATGLFVEHYQKYEVHVERPERQDHLLPERDALRPAEPGGLDEHRPDSNGYAAYKVANSVTTHEAWGLGSYCYFNVNPAVNNYHAFEVPNTAGVKFHDLATVSLGNVGTITHVINDTGASTPTNSTPSNVVSYPCRCTDLTCRRRLASGSAASLAALAAHHGSDSLPTRRPQARRLSTFSLRLVAGRRRARSSGANPNGAPGNRIRRRSSSMYGTNITIVGNVVDEVVNKPTTSGLSRVSFRVASTQRRRDRESGQWVDGHKFFVNVTFWREFAENVAASLKKGDPVVVNGKIFSRQYVKDESNHVAYEVEPDRSGTTAPARPICIRRMSHRPNSCRSRILRLRFGQDFAILVY